MDVVQEKNPEKMPRQQIKNCNKRNLPKCNCIRRQYMKGRTDKTMTELACLVAAPFSIFAQAVISWIAIVAAFTKYTVADRFAILAKFFGEIEEGWRFLAFNSTEKSENDCDCLLNLRSFEENGLYIFASITGPMAHLMIVGYFLQSAKILEVYSAFGHAAQALATYPVTAYAIYAFLYRSVTHTAMPILLIIFLVCNNYALVGLRLGFKMRITLTCTMECPCLCHFKNITIVKYHKEPVVYSNAVKTEISSTLHPDGQPLKAYEQKETDNHDDNKIIISPQM